MKTFYTFCAITGVIYILNVVSFIFNIFIGLINKQKKFVKKEFKKLNLFHVFMEFQKKYNYSRNFKIKFH